MAGNGVTPRMFLARELRIGRETKGMSRMALAKTLYVSESLVKQWETGRRVPTSEDIVKLDGLFSLNGMLVRIREDLVKTSVPLEWFGRWIEIESRATSLWSFQPIVIPGLLQTEDYARSILREANHMADVEEMVGARMRRQQILSTVDHDPPMFVAILAESVLWHNVGGPEVMADQLVQLARVAEQGNKIAVQVVPAKAQACAQFAGPFVIATFDGGNEVAYIDNALSGEVVEDPESLVRLRHMCDALRYDALSRSESIAMIMKGVERWKR